MTANPLDLARRVRVMAGNLWEPGMCGGVFWDVDDACDALWGPPLTTDPKEEGEAKVRAVNVVRRAIADEIGVRETTEISDWERDDKRTHEQVIQVLDRVVTRLEFGRYVRNDRHELVYVKEGACKPS